MAEDLDIPLPGPGSLYRASRSGGNFDPATRKLALLAGGIGLGVLLVAGLGSAVLRHRSSNIPVIEADGRPVKVKPDNPGGLQVSGQDDAILSGQAGDTTDALAPPPETPAPQALKSQEAARAAAVQAAGATAPAPAGAASAGLPDSAPSGAAPPAQSVSLPQSLPAAPEPPISGLPEAHTPHPAPSHEAAHGLQVQFAALGAQAAALAEWHQLSRRMPEVLGGRKPEVTRFEHDGHTFWRLRTGGFADATKAASFCEKVRAKGGGCSVARF